MTNEEKEKIIRKIKHCLALSQSSNENEAATALRQAHALMLTYNISDMDVELDDIKEIPSSSSLAKVPHKHQVMLASLIAYLFSCTFYHSGRAQRQSKMVFVGVEMYVTIATYAFDVLLRQMTIARREYVRNSLNRVRIDKNKTARADLFCQGWVLGVKRNVENIIPPSVNMALITYKISQKNNIRIGKPKNTVANSKAVVANDYYQGISSGKQAKLHAGMDNSTLNTGLLVNQS